MWVLLTGKNGILSSLILLSPLNVTLVDDSFTLDQGSGDVFPTSVFYLLLFPFNWLSVTYPTCALSCYVSFSPNYCEFQELLIRRIGREWKCGGLYVFHEFLEMDIAYGGIVSSILMDLHYHLGHLSLLSFKKLVSILLSLF